MTQIEAMTELLAQSNDEPDDVIKINSEGGENDELDPVNQQTTMNLI